MTVQEFMNAMNQLITEHPECLDMTVIASGDAAGNTFDLISHLPSMGIFDHWDYDSRIIPKDYELKGKEMKVVCVN
jgi:hypothetical protein